MALTLKDVLAAIAVVFNGLPLAMLALTYGFAAFPTALGFIVGGFGMVLTHQIAPISLQAESIVLAGTIGRNRNERLNIVFFTGILMAIIGLLGVLNATIEFIGPCILNAMMAGVGIMLAKSGYDMIKQNKFASAISILSAFIVYFATGDLIWTIVISVLLSTGCHLIKTKGKAAELSGVDPSLEGFKPLKFEITPHVIRSVLAVCTLQIGGNISYATITAGLAGGQANVDAITVYSGLADSASAFFGGGPVEAIISGTAAAPNPLIAGLLLVGFLAAIFFSKTVPKIAKYVPSQAIAGFLLVLGMFVVFPQDASLALNENPVIGSAVIIVTSFSDPFIGMIVGVALKYALPLLGFAM